MCMARVHLEVRRHLVGPLLSSCGTQGLSVAVFIIPIEPSPGSLIPSPQRYECTEGH